MDKYIIYQCDYQFIVIADFLKTIENNLSEHGVALKPYSERVMGYFFPLHPSILFEFITNLHVITLY